MNDDASGCISESGLTQSSSYYVKVRTPSVRMAFNQFGCTISFDCQVDNAGEVSLLGDINEKFLMRCLRLKITVDEFASSVASSVT